MNYLVYQCTVCHSKRLFGMYVPKEPPARVGHLTCEGECQQLTPHRVYGMVERRNPYDPAKPIPPGAKHG
jgi:hypothetical protein